MNVRSLEVCSDASVYSTTRGEPNWSTLGKRLGKALASVTKAIKALSEAELSAYERDGKVVLDGHELGPGDITIVREFRKPEGSPPCDAAGDGDVLVVLECAQRPRIAPSRCVRRSQPSQACGRLTMFELTVKG